VNAGALTVAAPRVRGAGLRVKKFIRTRGSASANGTRRHPRWNRDRGWLELGPTCRQNRVHDSARRSLVYKRSAIRPAGQASNGPGSGGLSFPRGAGLITENRGGRSAAPHDNPGRTHRLRTRPRPNTGKAGVSCAKDTGRPRTRSALDQARRGHGTAVAPCRRCSRSRRVGTQRPGGTCQARAGCASTNPDDAALSGFLQPAGAPRSSERAARRDFNYGRLTSVHEDSGQPPRLSDFRCFEQQTNRFCCQCQPVSWVHASGVPCRAHLRKPAGQGTAQLPIKVRRKQTGSFSTRCTTNIDSRSAPGTGSVGP